MEASVCAAEPYIDVASLIHFLRFQAEYNRIQKLKTFGSFTGYNSLDVDIGFYTLLSTDSHAR